MKKALTLLPFVIVAYWVVAYLCINSDWYVRNYYLLDYIDYVPVSVCIIHYFLNMDSYNSVKTGLVHTIIGVCLFQGLQWCIDAELYKFLYLLVLMGGISATIVSNIYTSDNNGSTA